MNDRAPPNQLPRENQREKCTHYTPYLALPVTQYPPQIIAGYSIPPRIICSCLQNPNHLIQSKFMVDNNPEPINGYTIDDFGDMRPNITDGPIRELIIYGDRNYEFQGQVFSFSPRKNPNVRLQVFNVVLGMIVEGQGETVTPGEVCELIDPSRYMIDAVRVALRAQRRANLVETKDQLRRRSDWQAKPELVLHVPTDVAITYKSLETTNRPPKRRPAIRGPILPPELLVIHPVPASNPQLSKFAECRGRDSQLFHPGRGQSTEPAKQICAGCVERVPCLEYALLTGERVGVRGGASARQRREIARLRALNTGSCATNQ